MDQDTKQEVTRKIRQLMEAGRLPRVIPPMATEPRWPTSPTAHVKFDTSIGVVRCVACEETGAEVSFHFPDGRILRFHGRCHRLWEEECKRIAGEPARS